MTSDNTTIELTKQAKAHEKPLISRLLPVYTYAHPILNERAINVRSITPDVSQFIADLTHTMRMCKGLGMAANQVGSRHNILVVRGFGHDHKTKNGMVFINPKIVEVGEVKAIDSESCLSLPGIIVDVERYLDIVVEYLDESFEPQKYDTSIDTWSNDYYHDDADSTKMRNTQILFSRVLQHEIDHLNGITLIEHLPAEVDQETKRKLKNISEGRSNAKYNTIFK